MKLQTVFINKLRFFQKSSQKHFLSRLSQAGEPRMSKFSVENYATAKKVVSRKTFETSGFTLMEIIVAVALITAVFAFGAFANVNLFTRQISISEESTLVGVLQKARSRAMNNIGADTHGVYVKNGEECYILFEGSSYTPDPDFCKPVGNSQFIQREKKVGVNMDGVEEFEIIFKQLSGNTEDDGTIELVDTVGKTKEVIVSSNGLINW